MGLNLKLPCLPALTDIRTAYSPNVDYGIVERYQIDALRASST
jgi:hypothetical protein